MDIHNRSTALSAVNLRFNKKTGFFCFAFNAAVNEPSAPSDGNNVSGFQHTACIENRSSVYKHFSASQQLRKLTPARQAENLRCNGIKPFACNIALHGAKGEKQSRRQQRRGRTVLFHSVRQGQNIAAEIRSPCGNEIFGNLGRDLLRAENINLVFANGNVARSVPVDSQSHKRTENIAVRELLGKFF